jgi:5-methylcytosine-specific restriction endonuclease McrA
MPTGVYNSPNRRGGVKGKSGVYKRPDGYAPKSAFKKGCVSRMKGKKHTTEANEKNRLAHLGKKYPNRKKPVPVSDETRHKMSLAKKGISATWFKGKKLSKERRIAMSLIVKQRVLDGKHNNYKGGITPINHLIREGVESKLWKESVLQRDNWTCQRCKIRGYKLAVHHIKPFAYYQDVRFALDNGITMCVKCHKEFHKKYGISNNIDQKIVEFLVGN